MAIVRSPVNSTGLAGSMVGTERTTNPGPCAPQATTASQCDPTEMQETPSDQKPTNLASGSRYAAPMDASPCVSPVNIREGCISTQNEAGASTLKDVAYYQGTSEPLNPRRVQKVYPSIASSPALPSSKRRKSCMKNFVAHATDVSSASLAELCTCGLGQMSSSVSKKGSDGSEKAKAVIDGVHQRHTAVTEPMPEPPCPPIGSMPQTVSCNGHIRDAGNTKCSAVPFASCVPVTAEVKSASSTLVRKKTSRILVKFVILPEGEALPSAQNSDQEQRPEFNRLDRSNCSQSESETPCFASRQNEFAERTVDKAEEQASDACEGDHHASDDAEGTKLLGAYAPSPQMNIWTTIESDFEVGLALGSRMDVLDEPLRLSSGLKKFDEGWEWSFE